MSQNDYYRSYKVFKIVQLAFLCLFTFALFFTRTIRKQDILSLPMGEKIAKVLEKRGVIG